MGFCGAVELLSLRGLWLIKWRKKYHFPLKLSHLLRNLWLLRTIAGILPDDWTKCLICWLLLTTLSKIAPEQFFVVCRLVVWCLVALTWTTWHSIQRNVTSAFYPPTKWIRGQLKCPGSIVGDSGNLAAYGLEPETFQTHVWRFQTLKKLQLLYLYWNIFSTMRP